MSVTETHPTDAVDLDTTAPVVHEPLDRPGLSEIFNNWPSWFGGRFSDRLLDETTRIKVEEFVEDGHLVIRAELPDVDPDKDVDIVVDRGRLTIRASREQKTESTENGFQSEFHYGRFARVLTLPEGAETADISANYQDGILEVRVPVPDDGPTSQRIEVKRA